MLRAVSDSLQGPETETWRRRFGGVAAPRTVLVEERDGERLLTFEHHAWFARLAQPFAR